MLNFIKNLFSSQSYLGVDIGTTAIKIAEIAKGKYNPELKNYGILESYGHLERINNAIQTSSLKLMENDTVELLKTILSQSKFKAKEVVASIPPFSVFTTLLEIPQMKNEDIAKTMQYQVKQYIPLPVSEVTLDWFMVGERQDDQGFIKQQILLVSVPNEVIEKYKKIFKLAGLVLKSVEIESLSIIRALAYQEPKPTLIVDVGARSTNIAAIDNGALKYNYQSDFAGASLTQTLASGLGINIRRAEKLKKEQGIVARGGEYELSTLMLPLLDAIISEAKRAKNNYEKSFSRNIEQIILAGGGAKLLGITDYFTEQIGLPVYVGNPFLKVSYPAAIEPIIKDLGPSFSVAIGLGIREFI
ncbi:MAG: type IV pilus assembly protein PilM [Patescibacteria group bacterium]|nr:type IV pilus assembly protein PilM [Patescibacteria group bacterium]